MEFGCVNVQLPWYHRLFYRAAISHVIHRDEVVILIIVLWANLQIDSRARSSRMPKTEMPKGESVAKAKLPRDHHVYDNFVNSACCVTTFPG